MKRPRHPLIPILLASFYFLLVYGSMGLRIEHLLLVIFALACYYLHPKTRLFILDFFPFVLFGALYDFLRIYPKNWAGPIHVVWPYELEKALFGFFFQGEKIIPNDFFRLHPLPLLDLLTGFTYSLHMMIPIGFAFYAWIRKPDLSREFTRAFLLANLLAFITYIALPVAPPWYVELYGLRAADWSIPPSAAGLLHFDRLIGHPYFEKIYGENAWPFGAIPSMHAGYPLLVVLYARRLLKKGMVPLYSFLAFVWFSAVYLRHHYIIDLLCGALYVLLAFAIVRKISSPPHP